MNFTPIGDRILVERVPLPDEETGIIIPETVQNTNLEAHVIVVGPGKELIDGTVVPMHIKPGDKIVYARFAGHEIKIDGRDLVILEEKDILAIIG